MQIDWESILSNQNQSEIFNPNQNSIRANPNESEESSQSKCIRGQNDLNWIFNPNQSE